MSSSITRLADSQQQIFAIKLCPLTDIEVIHGVQYPTLFVQHLSEQPLYPAIASLSSLIDSFATTRVQIDEQPSTPIILTAGPATSNENVLNIEDLIPNEFVVSNAKHHQVTLEPIRPQLPVRDSPAGIMPPSNLLLATDRESPISPDPIQFIPQRSHEDPSTVNLREESRTDITHSISPSRRLTRVQYKRHRKFQSSIGAAERLVQRSSFVKDMNNTVCVGRNLLSLNPPSVWKDLTTLAHDSSSTPSSLNLFSFTQRMLTKSTFSGPPHLAETSDTHGTNPKSTEILPSSSQTQETHSFTSPVQKEREINLSTQPDSATNPSRFRLFERPDKEDKDSLGRSVSFVNSTELKIAIEAESNSVLNNTEVQDVISNEVNLDIKSLAAVGLGISAHTGDRSLSSSIRAPKEADLLAAG
ncbi:hypothetical protein C0992_012382 [Termitomyces sp. T32_za158]|nr:hypothetical protein C0992_012382 [Termitomyces sp. T32_za158]